MPPRDRVDHHLPPVVAGLGHGMPPRNGSASVVPRHMVIPAQRKSGHRGQDDGGQLSPGRPQCLTNHVGDRGDLHRRAEPGEETPEITERLVRPQVDGTLPGKHHPQLSRRSSMYPTVFRHRLASIVYI
jgi:hypothetical protein